MYFIPEDKENYNPDSKTYSPPRLVNQKRYKVLKALTMNSVFKKQDDIPLKERTNLPQDKSRTEEAKAGSQAVMKPLEFVDESRKTYGI